MLGVDLDGSRRIQKDRLDDQTDDQGASDSASMPRRALSGSRLTTLDPIGVSQCGWLGVAVNSRQVPGTPLSSWACRSSKPMLAPTSRSFTVLETSTSPSPARAAIRAAMWTANLP